jgi:hypothetical protein
MKKTRSKKSRDTVPLNYWKISRIGRTKLIDGFVGHAPAAFGDGVPHHPEPAHTVL